MKKYLLIVALLITGKLFGQDSVNNEVCNSYRMSYSMTIKNKRPSIIYKIGDKPISYKEFIERLNSFPESAEEYRKAKRSQKVALIGGIAILPLLIAGGNYARKKQVSTPVIIGSGAAVGSALHIPMSKASKHRDNSLIIYNQKVCETPQVH